MKIAEHGPDLASLQELVDSVPALIHTARPDGYIDFFNQRWLEYVGLRLEDLEGWKWTAAVHPDDVSALVAKWRACLVTGEPFEFESRVRRADGAYRWMLHQKLPLRNASGEIVKWYGSSVDIDDRKRADEERTQAEFYLAEGQRLGHTGSWAFNAAGFDYWSPELFAIHGLAPAARRQPSRNTWRSYTRKIGGLSRKKFSGCCRTIADSISRNGLSDPTAPFGTSGASVLRLSKAGS
jgi:PAS domain S-box-containing protein